MAGLKWRPIWIFQQVALQSTTDKTEAISITPGSKSNVQRLSQALLVSFTLLCHLYESFLLFLLDGTKARED
jgi:hypothetical protein